MNRENEIFEFTKSLAGNAADETVLRAMCQAAADEMEARLREDISSAELGSRFVTSVGVLALSMYCAVENPEKLRSLKAGNLAVEYGAEKLDAEKLRAVAERMLASELSDRGFAFQGVTG